MAIEQVIECMLHGDLFYAQWGENCLNIEMIKLATGEESIEVVPNGYGDTCTVHWRNSLVISEHLRLLIEIKYVSKRAKAGVEKANQTLPKRPLKANEWHSAYSQ